MIKSGSSYLQQLVKFGLSGHEIKTYATLLEKGSLPAKKIAAEIGVLPNALYRILKKLVDDGLISAHGAGPTIYNAISPSIALDILTKQKIRELEEVKDTISAAFLKKRFPNQETTINFITTKNDFFKTYLNMAKQAKREILVISIGEPVNDEMKLVNRDAISRGVDFKMIAHKYDAENRELLRSYIKMAWNVRHFPDWGFHLIVVDGIKSVIAINNPKNTDERVALQIFSSGLSKALRDYFYSVWEKSVEIK